MKTQQMYKDYNNTNQRLNQNTDNRTLRYKNCLYLTHSADIIDGIVNLVKILNINAAILICELQNKKYGCSTYYGILYSFCWFGLFYRTQL